MLVLTNFIMNVAAIAISLPVALVIAKRLSVAPDVVMFSSLSPLPACRSSCWSERRLMRLLRFRAVHKRRVSHVWDPAQSHPDGCLDLDVFCDPAAGGYAGPD